MGAVKQRGRTGSRKLNVFRENRTTLNALRA
jgi:hypothetical protein